MPVLTSAVTASGSKMAIGDAFVTAVLGYAVVFFGLALLMAVIIIAGKIMVSQDAKKKSAETVSAPATPVAPAAPKAPPAPGTAGEVKLYGTSEKDAAMIMAIVANKMGKPLNELRFKSIKEVK
jgi:Na+-transporting methylmalonyl-CoA/oxaloacetate decarboxylase gamma subunit